MSADRAAPGAASRWAPPWLFPALAAWLMAAAAMVGNATSIAVRADVVSALLGALAIAHGLVQRRWRVAGPLAVLTLGTTVGLVMDPLPGLALGAGGASAGPAASVGVRAIWVAASVIGALVIAWGVWLHVRLRMRGSEGAHALGDAHDDLSVELRQRVDQVERRVGAIEALLAPRP